MRWAENIFDHANDYESAGLHNSDEVHIRQTLWSLNQGQRCSCDSVRYGYTPSQPTNGTSVPALSNHTSGGQHHHDSKFVPVPLPFLVISKSHGIIEDYDEIIEDRPDVIPDAPEAEVITEYPPPWWEERLIEVPDDFTEQPIDWPEPERLPTIDEAPGDVPTVDELPPPQEDVPTFDEQPEPESKPGSEDSDTSYDPDDDSSPPESEDSDPVSKPDDEPGTDTPPGSEDSDPVYTPDEPSSPGSGDSDPVYTPDEPSTGPVDNPGEAPQPVPEEDLPVPEGPYPDVHPPQIPPPNQPYTGQPPLEPIPEDPFRVHNEPNPDSEDDYPTSDDDFPGSEESDSISDPSEPPSEVGPPHDISPPDIPPYDPNAPYFPQPGLEPIPEDPFTVHNEPNPDSEDDYPTSDDDFPGSEDSDPVYDPSEPSGSDGGGEPYLPDDDTPVDSPVDTPVDTPVDSPLDNPPPAPVDSPVDVPVDVPVAPVEAAPGSLPVFTNAAGETLVPIASEAEAVKIFQDASRTFTASKHLPFRVLDAQGNVLRKVWRDLRDLRPTSQFAVEQGGRFVPAPSGPAPGPAPASVPTPALPTPALPSPALPAPAPLATPLSGPPPDPPAVHVPGVPSPGGNGPHIGFPNVGIPNVGLPHFGLPHFGLPHFGLPFGGDDDDDDDHKEHHGDKDKHHKSKHHKSKHHEEHHTTLQTTTRPTKTHHSTAHTSTTTSKYTPTATGIAALKDIPRECLDRHTMSQLDDHHRSKCEHIIKHFNHAEANAWVQLISPKKCAPYLQPGHDVHIDDSCLPLVASMSGSEKKSWVNGMMPLVECAVDHDEVKHMDFGEHQKKKCHDLERQLVDFASQHVESVEQGQAPPPAATSDSESTDCLGNWMELSALSHDAREQCDKQISSMSRSDLNLWVAHFLPEQCRLNPDCKFTSEVSDEDEKMCKQAIRGLTRDERQAVVIGLTPLQCPSSDKHEEKNCKHVDHRLRKLADL